LKIYSVYLFGDPVARPKRINQLDLLTAIKETAWQQIAEDGAAALSLRAIARALGITAPAIYKYYPSRDDLVTALIIDAYTSMGDAQNAALLAAPAGDHRARLRALGIVYRQWALAHPQHYQLIFGTPIPGYHALQENTNPAASGSLAPLISCLNAACEDGALRAVEQPAPPEPISPAIEACLRFYAARHVNVLTAALVVWSRVHGLVSLEIGNQYPPFLEDMEIFYQTQIDRLIDDCLTYDSRSA
jgi:AcrR family transcriptional regulator